MTLINDELINAIVTASQIESGLPVKTVATLGDGRAALLASTTTQARPALKWTAAEDEFLIRNHGWLKESEIAAALGRTVTALHIRWKRELRLTAPSKFPNTLTAEHVAIGLCMDGKSVHRLMDSGLMPCRRLPSDHGRVIRVIGRYALLQWMVNPEHWMYFKPERVGARKLRLRRGYTSVYDADYWAKARRLVSLRRARWEDAWLTPGQASRMTGLDPRGASINNAINDGRLPAKRWGNWWIKRSDLLAAGELVAYHGKGGAGHSRISNPRTDAFIVLAVAVGLTPATIAPLLGWPAKRLDYYLRLLQRGKRIAGLIRTHELPVAFNPRTGALYADWRLHTHRFPYLARVLAAFRAGEDLARPDIGIVRGVLHAYVAWHASSKPQHALEKRLRKFGGRHTAEFYHRLVDEIMAAGLGDPLRETKKGGKR